MPKIGPKFSSNSYSSPWSVLFHQNINLWFNWFSSIHYISKNAKLRFPSLTASIPKHQFFSSNFRLRSKHIRSFDPLWLTCFPECLLGVILILLSLWHTVLLSSGRAVRLQNGLDRFFELEKAFARRSKTKIGLRSKQMKPIWAHHMDPGFCDLVSNKNIVLVVALLW